MDLDDIRVLIVDDDPDVIDDLHHLLVPGGKRSQPRADHLSEELFGAALDHEAFPDVDLVICRQGGEAVESVRRGISENRPFALAFVDTRLAPGLDWLQTVEQIRAWDDRMYIVIVASSCEVHPLDICARVPPADQLFFIQKPFQGREVQQLVFALSARWCADGATRITRRPAVVSQVMDGREMVAAIQHYPFGTILFDRNDSLIAANPELLRLLPELTDVLSAGMFYQDMQKVIAENLVPEDALLGTEQWLRDRMNWHVSGGGVHEQRLAGDRTVLFFERVGAQDITYFHVLDVTELKRREASRASVTHLTAMAQAFAGVCDRLDLLDGGRQVQFTGEKADVVDPTVTVLHPLSGGRVDGNAQNLVHRLQAVAQRLKLNPESIDLTQVVSETVRALQRDLPKAVRTEVVEGAGLWEVLVDSAAVGLAIRELVRNAAEAMNGEGRLLIETSNARLTREFTTARSGLNPGDYVRLSVEDSGPGMSVDLAEHALNPFFTSKADLGHDGLGLSVAYGVVCQSGGYLEIGGKIGDGTRVDLYFPRATASAASLDTTVHLVPPRRRTLGQTN